MDELKDDREEYLDFFRGFIKDARAICDEIDEPMELVMPLLCVNAVLTTLQRQLVQLHDAHHQWLDDMHAQQREWLEENLVDDDEPWE